MQELTLENCWAKTDEQGNPALFVRDHCVDVGSVGEAVISRLPSNLKALLPSGGSFLIAAHDLGKISPGFQLKCPQWRSRWQEALDLRSPQQYESNHAKVSQIVLADLIPKPPLALISIGGHHGIYRCQQAKPSPLGRPIGDKCFEGLREELIRLLEKEFGSMPDRDSLGKDARLHWFTGLMIFSDWIGSNTTWFPLHRETNPLDRPREVASHALEEIGWGRHAIQAQTSFSDLFGFSPNALQQTLCQATDAPGLYIVEAPMGIGKTEAALNAAFRRWTEGTERGLYFALPTQLTSDRIHDRVESFLRRSVEDWSSIALVHGNAWLTDKRIRPLIPASPEDDPDDPALAGNRWFSDSRRALLAPFGVGTIDQALMSVLPVKFSALRMFALSGKVVVIDEVHSYDPYTSALVDRAVTWLLKLHCTVIVLSATLTADRRRGLTEAAGAMSDHDSQAYPLITKVATGSEQAVAIDIPDAVPSEKTVHIETSPAVDSSWIKQATSAAENGACVLIVRNTVALAQETYHVLKGTCKDTGIEFGCIHSRFTQTDRLCNETRWMEKLGREQTLRPAKGAILVGTQVLEQSVDIDADLLITDLAPVDLILQRMGRLHRHPRPRPEGFDQPRCLILEPEVDWNAEANELKESLKPHGFIYPPFSLYMSRRIWRNRSEIHIPAEIRTILEASADIPNDLPKGVEALLKEMRAYVKKQLRVAGINDVFQESTLPDAEGTQTRWKFQPTAHLVLVRSKPVSAGGKMSLDFGEEVSCTFTPGLFDFPLARLLHQHAIRVPAYLIRDTVKAAPDWLQQHFPGSALAVVDESGKIDLCHGPETPAYDFNYKPTIGLTHTRNENVSHTYETEEESWF